jgi:uncharacterized protein YciI
VVGYDRPDFPVLDDAAERDLDEAHWDYIDHAPGLLARGPILSPQHDGHAGSIHVIAEPDLAAAQQFALNEPYYLAGLYSALDIYGFESWLDTSMWERPGLDSPTSWFVRIRFDDDRPKARPIPMAVPDAVVCAGWLTAERPGAVVDVAVVGIALLVDGLLSEISTLTRDLVAHLSVDPAEVSILPWRRGGRTS